MNEISQLIGLALAEDIGSGDITGESILPKSLQANAKITAKEDMILAGTPMIEAIFKKIDKKVKIKITKKDGDRLKKGDIIASLFGPARSLLAGERTVLNFLQRLSGIATLAGTFTARIKGTRVKILDTRKTIPGLRMLEKYAVRCGGALNHRFGLYDMYLIKNNHVDIAGSAAEAILRAKHHRRFKKIPIEIEVRNFDELREAISTGADIIMLDNFTPQEIKKAIDINRRLSKIVGHKALLEASGGITVANVRGHAKTGIDFISIGSLTHSAKAVDIHMTMNV